MYKQESPPAWTQEAYHPQRSKSLGGTYLGQEGTYLGQGGTHLSWGVIVLARGYLSWLGEYLPWPGATYLGQGVPTLAGMRYAPPPTGVNRQTLWKQYLPVILCMRAVITKKVAYRGIEWWFLEGVFEISVQLQKWFPALLYLPTEYEGRQCFHRRLSFCSGGGGQSTINCRPSTLYQGQFTSRPPDYGLLNLFLFWHPICTSMVKTLNYFIKINCCDITLYYRNIVYRVSEDALLPDNDPPPSLNQPLPCCRGL